MKKLSWIFLFWIMNLSSAFPQEAVFDWAVKMGGTGFDRGLGMVSDKNGNTYYTGYFAGTADFDPGSGVNNLVSSGNSDVFISKYNSSGNLVWAERVGGTLEDNGIGITLDASDNIYVTGYFKGTVDFDPGPGTYDLVSAGGDDIFILKLGSAGNFKWARRMGGSSTDYSWTTATDPFGNIYNTGYFLGTADFDPGPGSFTLNSAGFYDCYITKLDSSGKFKWAKKIGGTSHDVASMVLYDNSLNVYITGHYMGTSDFDPSSSENNITSAGQYDAYIEKLDTSGNMVWVKSFGGTGNDFGMTSSLDKDGNIITTGSFQGTVNFGAGFSLTSDGSSDVYILKTNSSGLTLWAKKMGGTAYDESFVGIQDSLGNIYCTGYFQGIADFDPGPETYNLISSGLYDVFISKLDAGGNLVWAKKIGGAGNDYGSYIALDKYLNIYLSGYFEGTTDFNPGTSEFNLTSAGSSDVFLQKLKNCSHTSSTITVSACFNYIAPDGQIYTTSGVKSAVIPNKAGCDSTITINLTVKDVDIAVSQVSNNLTANASSAAYQWWDCSSNNEIAGETGKSFTAITNGSYAVRVTQDGCANTSLCYNVTTVNISENRSGNMSVYPNPTNGKVTIDLGEVLNDIKVVIADATGNVIRNLDYSGQQVIELTIVEPSGVYLVTISSGNQRKSLRVIKK